MTLSIQNYYKQARFVTPVFFQLTSEHSMKEIKKSEQKGLKLKGAYQLQIHTDDVNLMDKSINTVNRTTEVLLMVTNS